MRFLLVCIATIALASCDNKDAGKNSAAHDVQYYLDNPDARKETIAKCNNNPGDLEDTPDCVNAFQASEQAMNDSIDRAIRQE